MKRALASDADTPEAKRACREEEEEAPQLLHDVWKPIVEALHISDQVVMLAVSRDCRALALDAITETFAQGAMLKAGEHSTKPGYFTRNGRICTMMWSIASNARIVLSFKLCAPAWLGGNAFGVLGDLRTVSLPIDVSLYRRCIMCGIFSRLPGIALTDDAWICGQQCAQSLVRKARPPPDEDVDDFISDDNSE